MLYIISIVHGLFWLKLLPQSLGSLFLFEMPLVFLLSGYSFFLAEARREKSKPHEDPSQGISAYVSFLISRFTRILLPYFVYAVSCIAICYAYYQYTGGSGWNFLTIAISWLNPFNFASRYSVGMLSWHLWFIPPFLVVAALLPFVTKINFQKRYPLWMWMIGGTLAIYGLSFFNLPGGTLLKTASFYLLWALLGYHLAKPNQNIARAEYGWVALVSLAALLIIFAASFAAHPVIADLQLLNMQANKFPPNPIFFLFSCFWVSLFLSAALWLKQTPGKFDFLVNQFWLKPFIAGGYSIYLWQGLSYTAVALLGEAFGIPTLLVWLMAIILSVMLGTLAAPLEKVRIRR